MRYRLFLYDSENRIRAAEAYRAPNDQDALEIGAAIQSVSADLFERFEVRRGSEPVKDSSWRSEPTSMGLIVRHEEIVLEVEERLHSTFECVKRSRDLMETIDQLQKKRWYHPLPK